MIECQRRNTRQRQFVLQALQESHAHPTAAELHETVRHHLPRISLGTVYRNLDILQETGQAMRVPGGDGNEARFDGRTTPHHHFQCRRCGSLRDLESMLPAVDHCVGTTLEGHHVEGYSLVLRGVCSGCRT